MRQRVQVGDDVQVVEETHEGVQLESPARLRPGQLVDLVREGSAVAPVPVRTAFIVSWEVARLGSKGPIYRGFCRWQ